MSMKKIFSNTSLFNKKKIEAQDRREFIGDKLNFASSEAYKLLRTNLMFSLSDENECKVIGVTSTMPGEGKSTTALNLAYTIAQSGKMTLLIEADMRLPVVSKTLSINPTPGLSNVLAGLNTLSEAVRDSRLHKKLGIMPAGEIPPNPSEMLASKRMEKIVAALAKNFEYIIIDLPPVSAVSDSLTVAPLLSGMLMVVRQNYCDQRSLAAAMRQMEYMQIKILGFVLNGSEPPEKRYKKGGRGYSHKYGYGYGYGYGSENTPSKKLRRNGESPFDSSDSLDPQINFSPTRRN